MKLCIYISNRIQRIKNKLFVSAMTQISPSSEFVYVQRTYMIKCGRLERRSHIIAHVLSSGNTMFSNSISIATCPVSIQILAFAA